MRDDMGIKIHLLGKVHVEVFGQVCSFPYRQVKYLLAYLAMERQMAPRSLLAQMLWPGIGGDVAAGRLRQALHNLHRSLNTDETIISASRSEVGLHPQTKIWIDIHAIKEHVEKGRLPSLRKILSSTPVQFLGEEKSDGHRWNAWVKKHRDGFEQTLDAAFHLILQSDKESNGTDELLDWAARWVRWRPLADAPQCAMAELLLEAGRPQEAAQQLARYRKELAERLGRKPDPECLELHNRAQFLCEGRDRRKSGGHGKDGLAAMASSAGSFHRYFVWIIAIGPQDPELEDGFGLVDEHLNLCFDMAKKIAQEYGGFPSVTVKGWIEIRFGLENQQADVIQAVRAAFALRQAVPPGHSPYIGLHCGKLMVDASFSIFIGDVGEKAASVALRDRSGQGVVLSAEAWAILRNHRQIRAEVEKLGNPGAPVADEPAYRLKSHQVFPELHGRAKFVGRKEELAMIRAQAAQVLAERSGRMIWVLGEAGIGKSRLVMEAGAILPGEMAKVVYRCSFQQQRTLLYPVANLVREFFALSGVSRPAGAQRLREGLARFAVDDPDIVRIWTIWLGLAGQETPVGNAAVGDKETLMESLLDILPRFLSHSPRLLMLEDFHWADLGSMELVARFLQNLANLPVLLLLTTRHRLPTLEGIAPETFLDLGPLAQSSSLTMLRNIRGGAREDDLAIVGRAAGVPLYLEALASDALPKARGGCGIADIAAPPADLLSILDATVSIGRVYLDVLQAAAVIGEVFTQDCVLALLPDTTAARFGEALAFLTKHGIWKKQQGGIAFRHMLVRDAVYNGTPASRRRHLHAAAAECFSAMEQGVDPAYLGWHYLHADMPGAAAEHLLAAAQRSLSLGMASQAAALYREIVQLIPPASATPADAATDLAAHCGLYLSESQISGYTAEATVAALADLAQACDRHGEQGACRLTVSHGQWLVLGATRGCQSALEFVRSLAEPEDSPERLPLFRGLRNYQLGWCFFWLGQASQAEWHLLSVVGEEQIATVVGPAGIMVGSPGFREKALAYLAILKVLHGESGGGLAAALLARERASDPSLAWSDTRGFVQAMGMSLHYWTRCPQKALAGAEALLGGAERCGGKIWVVFAQAVASWAEIVLDRPSAPAIKGIEASERDIEKSWHFGSAFVALLHADALIHAQRDACGVLARGLRCIHRLRIHVLRPELHYLAGRHYRRLGQLRKARRHFLRAIRAGREAALPCALRAAREWASLSAGEACWPEDRADLAEALSLLEGEADLPAGLQGRLDAMLERLAATPEGGDPGSPGRRGGEGESHSYDEEELTVS
jgi:DNA-binding SARP family transcriptional activator/tetratricopeptide (TPR) repeat protein